MKFSGALRLAREHRRMSLRQAAKATGVSAARLSQLESGAHRNPTRETMQALTTFYRLKPEVWFE